MSRRFVTVFAGVLAWAFPARAEPLERGALRLEWSAPGGCPNGAEVALRIEALLGARITDMTPEPIAARGRVTELGPLRYELELETHQRDQRFVRSMQAPSCAELSDAGALVLALAIDPTLAERRARASEPAPPGTSALPSEQPPAAQAPAPTPPARKAAPGAVTTLDSDDPPDEVETTPPSSRHWFARMGVWLDGGSVADSAYGFGVGAGVPFGSFRAELGFIWLPPVHTVIANEPERGGAIDLAASDLVGCWLPLEGAFEAAACAVLELGRLHGSGFGTDIETEGSSFWLAAGPSVSGRVGVGPAFTLAVTLGLLFPAQTDEFTLENVGVVHQVSPAVLRFGLAVETEFY